MTAIKLETKSIKTETYQENKPWSQAYIHLRKLEPILETKKCNLCYEILSFLNVIN